MADPFVAEIRIFPYTFAPTGWAKCNGQILPISQNTALFSLLGTTYGGDGQSTFALPNLQGNVPLHQGQGPGLSLYDLGQEGGSDTVTLLQSEMPLHTHTLRANEFGGDKSVPAPTNSLAASTGGSLYVSTPPAPPLDPMGFNSVAPAGGSLPHNNLQPYLTLNFCIALQGVFPPQG